MDTLFAALSAGSPRRGAIAELTTTGAERRVSRRRGESVKTRSGFCAVLATITVIACGYGGTRIAPNALVVRNGAVFDGTGAPPIVDGVVVVAGERILAVGEAAAFQIPENVTVVDAGGGTILPGIINSHTHSTHDPVVRRAFLTDGVTAVCNLGTRSSDFPSSTAPRWPRSCTTWIGCQPLQQPWENPTSSPSSWPAIGPVTRPSRSTSMGTTFCHTSRVRPTRRPATVPGVRAADEREP